MGNGLTDEKLDLPQGTLDLLILKAVSLGPMHGWAISERIHQVSHATLQIPQGSLYPALHRLERRGWISAEWGASDNNRRAKYYELTRSGRNQLELHIDHEARKLQVTGLSPDDALRQARLAFGGVERIKDDTRDTRGISWLETFSTDVRYAL